MTEKSNILVCLDCIDITRSSNITLRYACYKAKKTGFSVQILVVIESSYKSLLFVSKIVGEDKRAQVQEHLKNLIEEVGKETGIIPTISIREGDVAREILEEIKADQDCAMVILGKSSTSLSDNTVLPIISRKIGSIIKVPVVVVPDNMHTDYLKRLS